jgi:hypothetical protein
MAQAEATMTAEKRSPRRRALLVGSPWGGLEGVGSDIVKMGRELRAWGFEIDELVGAAATRDGILGAVRELALWAQEGDAVVIYYSGHGGRAWLVADESERDRPAWAFLVPMDIEGPPGFRGIADLELSIEIDALSRRTANVTVILDCCHSAGQVRNEERVRAFQTHGVMSSELQQAFQALLPRARELHHDSNPRVVRIIATAPAQYALEAAQPPHGEWGGYLTHELCAALEEARRVPQPWSTIVGQVRERVMVRRKSTTQRPDVEGPSARLPFSLDEAAYDGERAVLIGDSESPRWIRAGRLQGLREQDLVEVQARVRIEEEELMAVVASGRIVELFDDSARLELEPSAEGLAPRLGHVVVPRRLALRRTVQVEPSALEVGGLVEGISRSLRLKMVSDGEPADFVVALGESGLHVSGPVWLHRVPRPATSDGVAEVVADLDALARSEILLAALDAARDPEVAGPSGWQARAFVTEPEGKEPRKLEAGERLRVGTRIYVELRGAARGGPTLYVNVLDRGVSGRIELVNQSEPAGVQLPATEVRWVGRRPNTESLGMRLAWPRSVPEGAPGREELVVVVSERPLDLRSLLEGPKAKRDTEGQRRGEPRSDELGMPLGYAVTRLCFELVGGGR